MKRFITSVVLLLLIFSINADAQIWGNAESKALHFYCIQDSTVGITEETLLDISGQGILHRITVDNANATAAECIEVTIDGTEHADSTNTTTTTVYYLKLDNTPSATTTEDYFLLSTTEGNVDIPFKDNLKIQFRCKATATMYVQVHYSVPGRAY